jgi:hypothetical protein
MRTQQPKVSEDEHVVLQFRPRGRAQFPERRPPANSANDSSPGEADCRLLHQTPDEPDDFGHRMLANAAAFAFTIALTAVGLWLAVSIADLRGIAP